MYIKKPVEIIPEKLEEKCVFCGKKAIYYINKNKNPCCENSLQKCPEIKKRNSKGLQKAHKNKEKWFNGGYKSWNNGLTKENCESLRKASETYKKGVSTGKIIPSFLGKKHSEETRKKWKENPNMGGLRHGSGRGKKGWYKGFYCRSTWELAWLVYQLEHDIKVEKCNEFFEYEFENEIHKYYPDFLVNESYIEIKGYRYANTQAKIDQFPKEKSLVMIEGKKEIKPYLDYVEKKYGKEFWKILYENKFNG